MKTRKLGFTNVELSTVGLGTWAHGGGGWDFSWGPQDDLQSERTIRAALDAGVNWIDTAPAYGLGHAEEVLGRALKTMPRKPFVATKCSLVWDSNRKVTSDLSAKSVRAECEASLKRLQVDVIDLYQIHWPRPAPQLEEGWGEIARLIADGKVRFAGVSNFSVEQIKRVQAIHPVASLQPPYSMLQRSVEKELLAFCRANRIGMIAYSPLQKGLLTGKVNREYLASLPADDHRTKRDPMFLEPLLTENLKKVDALRSIADARKISMSELALAWILRRPEVTAVIAGGRTPEQIRGTARAMDVVLSEADLKAIEQILSA